MPNKCRLMTAEADQGLTSQECQKRSLPPRSRRIASISIFPDYARAGGLMGYGPSLTGMFRRSARYVDAVLRGRPPAELPVRTVDSPAAPGG